jgi:hypothetical protein
MGRIWTDDDRLKQAERIRNQKPWTKSTGPRTISGKRASSSNSYKHGSYTTEMKQIFRYLKLQKNYIATLRLFAKQENLRCLDDVHIFENELNKNPIKSIKNATNRNIKDAHFVASSLRANAKQSRKLPNITGLPRRYTPHNDNSQEKTHLVGWVFRNFISDTKIIQRLPFS